jgi:hypothetical protein
LLNTKKWLGEKTGEQESGDRDQESVQESEDG